MGKKNGILTQGYYVDYYRADERFMRVIRNYYDFIVRYENILYDSRLKDVSMTHAEGDNLEYVFENFPFSTYGEVGKVWIVARESGRFKTISLINLTGCKDDFWCSGKDMPPEVRNLTVRIQIEQDAKSVFLASPDYETGRPQPVKYRIENGKRGKNLVAEIPELYIWNLLVVEFET